jgi:ComF family protein
MPGNSYQQQSNTPTKVSEAQLSPAGLLSSSGLFRRWINVGLDLLFPPQCSGCGRVDESWCRFCQQELEQLPIIQFERPLAYGVIAAATGVHTGRLQQAVHALKYEQVPSLADTLGARLADRLQELGWEADALVPVPLHPDRLAQRGYNQAALLAQSAGNCLSLPVATNIVTRSRDTRQQAMLTRTERLDNMRNAFVATTGGLEGKRYIIVDDVLTTGATLGACAAALKQAGAASIHAITVTTASLSPT